MFTNSTNNNQESYTRLGEGTPKMLPPVPYWFEKELKEIATLNGRPMFRLVDGQRETIFRNGRNNTLKYYPNRRNCWVVEVYTSPYEISEEAWNAERFQILPVMGVPTEVDVHGEFPRAGRYIYCLSITNEAGEAISPNRDTISELRRRVYLQAQETKTAEQYTAESYAKGAEAEERELEQANDNFYQWAGISAKREKGGVISKPITKTF
jgi:hypothetical protein